ncbi:hypothetical protein [Streptomyces sp. NBC_01768]|uniref:hypothetical protein n=1 Tax=Streptomyces sp. NBC_01768 TaxID=2975938 RepID=UPI002DDB7846|nr:hypothetical protein [Streptomyces sp. NBC_01768]WSC32359.1 hypothetical protein OG902_39880 [Streptomyces sp. NBC_01768]
MAQRKDLEKEPADRRRTTKALPVGSNSTSQADSHSGTSGDWQRAGKPQGSVYASWDARSDEPFDAEVTDEARAENADGSRAWRERLRERTRGFFGEKTRERMADRERVRWIDVDRAEAESDDLDQREQLLKLRAETRLAGEKYMASLRDSKLLVPGFNDEERDEQLSAMQHVYMQMMMQSCLKPLSRGVNTNSVIQAAGMMMAMRMLSPDFKKEMGSYLQPLKDKIQERIDTRARAMVSSAEGSIAHRQKLFGDMKSDARRERLVGSTDPRDHLTKKWRKRFDAMQHRERGHREMFTPDSAAMTEVALMENAFWKMREPGADVGQIRDSYRAMRKRLHDQMGEDGLERQEVVQRARLIIGERMEYEPELRTMFNGVAHGRIVKAPAHEKEVKGTNRVRRVWSGEFDDQLGHRLPGDAMFTLRRPMDGDVHQVQLAETMRTSMLDALACGDQKGYGVNVLGYLVGFAAKRQGLDTSGLPGMLQHRLDQSEVMIASMDIDGLAPEEQQRVYSNAYVDAMEAVNEEYPDLVHELKRSLGENWKQTLQTAVDDPRTFFEEQRSRSRSHRTGPSPEQEAGPQNDGPNTEAYQLT